MRRFYYDGSNSLLATATFGPGIDQPISLAINGQVYHYHSDALGSIYQMTDSTQAVAKSYDYSAFGKIISETGTLANPFAYTAREYDSESGLYYYRARCYDAAVGRFLSRDPIGIVRGISLYSYATNNPLRYRDPTGLGECEDDYTLCLRMGDDLYQDCLGSADEAEARSKSLCDWGCGFIPDPDLRKVCINYCYAAAEVDADALRTACLIFYTGWQAGCLLAYGICKLDECRPK